MALDREKAFANAERLMKQGKVSLALTECRRLAEDAPKDLLMLNRLGDFLARSNRGADAIVYYEMIAEQFSVSGFYPKAIAILKKIVKVDPSHLASIVRLGDLNLKQKLPGEARVWLLQAAEAYLRAREFSKAREVYEKLVAAEPGSVVHPARLAEARAAEGDAGRAGLELVALGGRMLASGLVDDAERTFKRAAELMPGRAEPIAGSARCLAAAGRREDALRLADEAWERGSGAEAVAGTLFLLFEQLGDTGRLAALVQDAKSDAINDDAIEQAFRASLAAGAVDALWSRVLPLFDRWSRARQFDRAAHLIERIARIEDGGHLPALERLVELRKAEGDRGTTSRAIERLVRAYQSKGLADKVASQLESLKLFDPTSPLLFAGRGAADPPVPKPPGVTPAPDVPVPALEAPAVPLTPADVEFVNGNLTEAEVFEKYGLHREALQQLRQITARFPGHVVSQEKLVSFLRTQADEGALRDGLVALALAKRASGDTEGARRAAREAAASGEFEAPVRAVLQKFDLLQAPEPARAQSSSKPVPKPAPKPAPKSAPPPPAHDDVDADLEISFDDAGEVGGSASSETLEEIEFYLGQGMELDALARITEARAAGLQDPALDALEARARGASAVANAVPSDKESEIEIEVDAGGDADGDGKVEREGTERLDEDDLSSITAALEAEYGTDRVPEVAEPPPTPESERSVSQVFDSFKEHVSAAVEVGDFRTHYDLGIAYKEMGLVDDALAEFRVATGAPELYRDACSMLGLCHWERGETEESIRWYRAALDAPSGEETGLSGIRYDLAERLEQIGDARGAYELLEQVLREEPGYRDVDRRAAALRSKLGL